jgi:putative spermidine/putrescine transport system permease protein
MSRNGPLALAFNALFVTFMLAPLAVVVAVSLTPTGYLEFPPSGLSLRWFRAILDNPDFIAAFWTSLYLGIASATLATLVAVPAATALPAAARWSGSSCRRSPCPRSCSASRSCAS